MSNLKDYIILYGDQASGTDIAKTTSINKLIADLYPAYIFGLGDHQYTDANTTKNVCNGIDRWGVVNRIYAVPGNHDNDQSDNRASFNAFFNRKTYQKVTIGKADFFLFDNYLKDDGTFYTADEVFALNVATTQSLLQSQWLINQLNASTNTWKIVLFHQNCWSSSGNYGGGPVRTAPGMQWDWKALGVDLIINSHQHYYERLLPDTGSGMVPVICIGHSGGGPTDGPIGDTFTPIASSEKIISGAATSTFYDADCANGFVNILQISASQLQFNTYGINASNIMSASKDQLILNK